MKAFAPILLAAGAAVQSLVAQTYVSPFAITLDPEVSTWTSDFSTRSSLIVSESSPAPADWYSTDYGSSSYGPLNPQLFSASSVANPAIVSQLEFDRGRAVLNVPMNSQAPGVSSTRWQQERLLAAAKSLIGTHYQHLHLPTFDPAAVTGSTFPWQPVSTNSVLQSTQQLRAGESGTAPNPYAASYGSAQPGIDCTDFSAYAYNLALGIQMHSGTSSQITFSGGAPAPGVMPTSTLLDSSGQVITPNFIMAPSYGLEGPNAPGSLDGVIAQLQPGDLLYMKGGGGTIAHVVMWLGVYGTNADGSPSTVPLVISSHDNTPAIFDTQAIDPVTGYPLDGQFADHLPPPGVQILPFTPENWFYQNFSVAMNIIPEPAPIALVLLALAAVPLIRRRRPWRPKKAAVPN